VSPPAQVTANVFFASGTAVNWVLLRDGGDLTLIDGGYPGDLAAVEETIRHAGGRPEDVRAILVTHAHVDHLGAVSPFHRRYGTPAYLDPAEVPHARREYLEQLSPARLAANLWRPGVLPWAARIVRAGAMRDVAAPHAQPFPAPLAPDASWLPDQPQAPDVAGPIALDLPGGPVPVPAYGHTSGHTAYFLPAAGAVVTGDALITGHPVAATTGPQLPPAYFTHDQAQGRQALGALARLDADVILPGHGPVHRGPLREAVAAALSMV
jgi:glyoxylase-like metal-dependent hydrolase (beta-lactamase superfamily II)